MRFLKSLGFKAATTKETRGPSLAEEGLSSNSPQVLIIGKVAETLEEDEERT